MKKHVYNERGDVLLRIEESTPACGKDFCDSCGDCLWCFGGDPCWNGDGRAKDGHHWVKYEEVELIPNCNQ